MARKILLGFRDWARTGTFYNGSWNPFLPLANLQDPRPQWVAQASSSPAATFDVDFGAALGTDVFTFINLGVSKTGTIRVRASTDLSFATTVYDSGTVSAWPQDNQGNLYENDEFIALGRPRWLVTPAQIICRYVRVDFNDPGPMIQLGCFCASLARQPSVNFSPGWEQAIVDESFVERVPFGSAYVTRRGMRRQLNLGFQALPFAEIFEGVGGAQLNWMATVHGGWLPIVVVPFPDDVGNLSRTAIYGLLKADNHIRNSMFGRYEHLMQVEQLI